ncbi:Speckle-type POZ protein [Orchesella cincta]|uniref:Speckle-type POZ protein n=1 Tax=Orchesella cincta TaxID=48709 RepID=A0A1D2MJB6_ORCCI|nr:Speckle-type POZ protein [Orchesella cincta]
MASNQGGNYQGPWLWPLVQGVRSMIATAGSSSVLPTGPAKRHCTDYSPENVDSVASTEVEMDEFAFLWISLVLAAFGGTDNNSNRKLKARFQITILDAEGRPDVFAGSLTAHSCEFTNGTSRWGYNKLLLYSDLMEPTRRLVVDDTIKIHCRVCVEGELTSKIAKGCTVARAVSAEERKTLRKEQLVNDFGNLLKHSRMSDLTIISPQNVLHAHKALLAARSSVFATMFASTNLESLEILEFDDEVIKGMLEYIYTGKTALLADRAPELLHIIIRPPI